MRIQTFADASGKPLVRRRIENIDDALAEIRGLEARIMEQARTIRSMAAEIASLAIFRDGEIALLDPSATPDANSESLS